MASPNAQLAAASTGARPSEAVGLARINAFIRNNRGVVVPLGFVSLLAVILVPMPPVLLDVLIAANIALSVIVLLTTIYMDRPLEFSVFPSLLLATTLFRLGLNIASTRLILTADANTPEEAMGVAGKVIGAFGEFVAGGSLFVGIVIAAILMIVQFMVVTKGAGRVSEVAARFTLDAMPGKQMAIDSDLNAGAIDENEARKRREDIRREADFFGAMDGASKFVRGDAIASIIITGVNIMGGFAVGMVEKGWPAMQTAETFTKLSIGDGLSSQLPSLIISVASALIVTRSGDQAELGSEMADQLGSQPRGLVITAIFLAVLAMTPLPTLPLLAASLGIGAVAFSKMRAISALRTRAQAELPTNAPAAAGPPPVESLLKVDTLELEVGYGLVVMVDAKQGGDILDRISAVRRQLAVEMGVVMPPVRIRDNVQLQPNEYRIKIRGNPVASGVVYPGRVMAMDSGVATGRLDGESTTEPSFGLPAVWIDPIQRVRAETMNYTVVEAPAVVTTHISEIVRRYSDELLTREEVNNLVEGLKERTPRLIEEAIPALVKVAELHKVLQNLLRERVPIRDLESIIEAMAEWGPRTKDLDVLTEYVRNALKRSICGQYAARGENGRLSLACVTLDPSFEDAVSGYIDRGANGTSVNMPSRVSQAMGKRIVDAIDPLVRAGRHPVVIASPQVRSVIRQIIEPMLPIAAVLGYHEVVADIEVESFGLVTMGETSAQADAKSGKNALNPSAA